MTQGTAHDSNHPPLLGIVSLMRRAHAGENLVPLGQALLERALKDPLDANACLDFSTVLMLTGNPDHALAVQKEAIKIQPMFSLPARRAEPGIRLLLLKRPGDLMANTPVEFLVEDSDVSLQILYLPPEGEWPEVLPDHDVAMVAVGESDDSQAMLQRLSAYVADWPRPLINHPDRIAALSRDRVSLALRGIPGTDVPMSVRISRGDLQAVAKGEKDIAAILPDGGFPIIVRPLGSHAGNDLEKIEAAADIQGYLDRTGADGFYIARFVNYRSADGQFRKYRIALVEGKPYICHFAVSTHWIIHYVNAGMMENAEKRAEEARCMESFDTDFAIRHAAALRAIHERMGLPYLIIDCAETQAGELLIFEVDNSAVVHAIDSEAVFPYKIPAMRKVFAGFRQMLENVRRTGKSG